MHKYVAPSDIAAKVFALLTDVPAGKTIHYVISDTFTGDQLISALAQALNLPDLKYVEISDEQFADGLRQVGVPETIVQPYLQSTQYEKQPDQLYADLANHDVYIGQVKLADFAQQFAAAYRSGNGPQAHTVVSN